MENVVEALAEGRRNNGLSMTRSLWISHP